MGISREDLRLTLRHRYFVILLFVIGRLLGCIRNPAARNDFDKTQYQPLPRVEISRFFAGHHIAAVFVRHSKEVVMFRLSSDRSDYPCDSACGRHSVVTLSSSDIKFCSAKYETFGQSFDMFGDGRIILVPLPGGDRKAVGVFVNLVSGKRYFLAPSVMSPESLAKIRWLARARRELTVILPEEKTARDYLPQFPEFHR
jgi:hypothetical protein